MNESQYTTQTTIPLHWKAAFLSLALLTLFGFGIILYLISRLPTPTQSPANAKPTPEIEINKEQTDSLQSSLQSLADRVAKLEGQKPIVTQTRVTNSANQISEIFIPFGSGTTTNDQWEDISGTEAYIDTAKYRGIDTVYFEVAMHIPTKNGIVYTRLYNVTDKHPVWFSEVSTTADKSTFLATKINLDTGNKQYRVQMKTSLKYESILDFARVKILLK